MSVLLITRSDDNDSVKMVARALTDLGLEPIRLDTDLYPISVRLTTSFDGPVRRMLETKAGRFDLSQVSALWYRRYFAGGRLPLELGDTREACVGEARRTMYGCIASMGCFQLDPLICVRKTDHKELQLQKAREFGLEIPPTLITNDPEEVKAFFHAHDGNIVTKTQSSFAIYRGGEEQVVFTTPVRKESLEQLDGLRYAPMMFQALIPKKVELRSTVTGKRVHTAYVDSQKSELSSVDWRRDGVGLIDSWHPYELPDQVREGLLRVTEHFGLNYAAADFIVTPDDRYVFLEINAGGEWFWLQRILPIAESLAEVLAGKAQRIQPLDRTLELA
ncbi:MAG: ATP-grasp ribosomal peptide maturase [Candidatus Xenobia bacterium]